MTEDEQFDRAWLIAALMTIPSTRSRTAPPLTPQDATRAADIVLSRVAAPPVPLRALAVRHGITLGRVRSLESHALRRIRHPEIVRRCAHVAGFPPRLRAKMFGEPLGEAEQRHDWPAYL